MEDIVASFGKVTLTEKEEVDIVIGEESIDVALDECKHSVLVKVLSEHSVNQNALKVMLRRVWGLSRDVRCVTVGEGILHVKLGCEFLFWRVMDGAPWNFENILILLTRWEPGLTTRGVIFDRSLFWVQIWSLPFECRTKKVAEVVGNRIGIVQQVDSRSDEGEQRRYMRVRVSIDVGKPLLRGGFIKVGSGKAIWIDYCYEKLPMFCYHCGLLGHEEKVQVSFCSISSGGG